MRQYALLPRSFKKISKIHIQEVKTLLLDLLMKKLTSRILGHSETY